MIVANACFSCTNTAADGATRPSARILRTDHWRLAHAFGTTLPSWLVLMPTVHVEALAGLPPEAAGELGSLLRIVNAALPAALGCEKTYVVLFAEAPGFRHLYFHVVPRAFDQPEELRGAAIFAALGHRPEDAVQPAEMDEVASRIRAHLPSDLVDPP